MRYYIVMKVNKLFFILFLLLTGCGTGSVSIQSIPEDAKVSIITADGSMEELGSVGKYTERDIFKHGDTVQLLISKPNYIAQSVVLSKGSFPKRYYVSVKLKRDGSENSNFNEGIEEVAKAIASSYNFLKDKDYDSVVRLLAPLVNQYDGVSVLHDFLGNAYYLKGNYKKAYRHYNAALQLNPNNFERQAIVKKLREMINP